MGPPCRFRFDLRRLLPALGVGLGLWLASAAASAFCRSTTCTGDDCKRDAKGCKTTGKKLAWPGVCVGFSLQKDGSVNLTADQVRPAIDAAFATWSELPCEGGLATIAFSELDDVSCHATEYNPDKANANVILFQDNKWKYQGPDDTLAKTTVTYDNDSGEILDADIEINHAYNEFTVGDDHVVVDLQSVLTHEIGHFIGLDHTLEPDATMFAGYDEGSTELRSLEADDLAAVCAVYPPTRSGKCETKPKNGLADECLSVDEGGCTAAPRAAAPASWRALVVALASALALARRLGKRE